MPGWCMLQTVTAENPAGNATNEVFVTVMLVCCALKAQFSRGCARPAFIWFNELCEGVVPAGWAQGELCVVGVVVVAGDVAAPQLGAA